MALKKRQGKDRQDEEARKERIQANRKMVCCLRIENVAGGQKRYRGNVQKCVLEVGRITVFLLSLC